MGLSRGLDGKICATLGAAKPLAQNSPLGRETPPQGCTGVRRVSDWAAMLWTNAGLMRTTDLVRLPLLMAASVVLTFALAVLLARWTPAIADHVARELEREQATNGLYLYDAGYADDADYVLLAQLPFADFSRGGVLFLGDSKANAAIRTWELPPEERALIHNFSIGDLRYLELRQYLEMLVEEFGLLEAGGGRTTVFLSLSRQMTRPLDYAKGGYVRHAFRRHGLYDYDAHADIHRIPSSPFELWLRSMRNDAQRFLAIAFHMRPSRVKLLAPNEQTPEFNSMGSDWRAAMDREVMELAAALDYLQARGAHVRVIFRPTGTWEAELPYEAAHRALVMPILEARGIPILDQSDALTDSEFMDSTHPSHQARRRLHEIDRQMALDALHDMGTEIRRP